MASKEYRPSKSKWETIWIRYRLNGVRAADGPYTTEISAEKAMRAIERRVPRKKRTKLLDAVRPQKALTWAEVIDEWAAAETLIRKVTDVYAEEVRSTVLRLVETLQWRTPAHAHAAGINEYRRSRNGVGCTSAFRYIRRLYRWAHETLDQAFDRRTWLAMRPPQSNRSETELADDSVILAMIERAALEGQHAVAHCLATYGWRGMTASRLTVGDVHLDANVPIALPGGQVLVGASITLKVKRRPHGFTHPILPETIELLRPLVVDRPKDAPLFLSPKPEPDGRRVGWRCSKSAWELTGWIYRYAFPRRPKDAPEDYRTGAENIGRSYALKRYAINKLRERGVALDDIALITGHRCVQVLERYLRPDFKRAAAALGVVAQSPVGVQQSPQSDGDRNDAGGTVLQFPRAATGN